MAEKSIQFTMNPHFAKEFARRKVLWQPRHLVDKNVRDKALVEFGHILGYNLDPKAIIRKMLLLCFRFQRAYKQKILNLITECYKTGVPMHEALTISKAPKWMAEVDKELQILPAFIQQINTQTQTGNPEPGPSASHYNVKFRVLPGDEATTSNVHKESISGLEPEGEDNKSGKDDSGTEAVENRCLVENISKQMESNGLPMSEFVKAVVKKAHLMQTTSGQNIMKALARRMNTSTNTLCNIWTRITAISMWKLRTLLKAGDISGKVDSFIAMTYDDWLVTDVILMYGQPGNLITSTNLSSRHLLRPLVTLFHLVQTYHIEEKCSLQTLKLRWQALTRQYNAGETSASSVLLQRRWYELKRAAGRQLRARWRQGDRGPAPHPLYTVIARRYTHVVIEPMAVWWHMVGVSAVFHFQDDITKKNMEPVVNEKEDSDDDVILIEKQIETIDIWSDHEEEENRLVIDETMAIDDKQESDFREQRNELREQNMEVDAQNVVPSNVAKVSYLSRQNIDLLQHSLDVDIQVSDSYIHNKPKLVQSPSQAKTHDTIQRIDKNVDIEIANINIENRDTDKGNDNSIKDTAGHQKNVDSPNCGTMSKQVPDSNIDSSTIHTEENNESTNLNNSNTDKQSNQSSILNTKECVGDIDKLNETDNVLKEISDLSKESSPMDVQEDTVEKTNLSQQSPNIDFPLNIQTNSNTQNINEAKTRDQETMRALNNQDLNKQSNLNVANVADREKQNNKSNDTNKDLDSRNDNRDNNKDQQQSNKAKSSKTTLVGKETELQNKNSTNPESSHLIKTYTESLNDYANINKEIRKYTVKKPQSAKKILIMSPNEINSKFDGMDSNITEKNSENIKSRGLLLKLLTKPHRKLNEMNTGYYQFTHEAAANKIPKDTTKTVEKNDNAVEKSETLQMLDELDPNKAETTLIFDSDSDDDILDKDKQDDANTNNTQCKNSKYTSDVLMNEVLDNLRSESVDNLSINNLVETQTGRNDTRSSNSSTFVELLSRNRQTGSNHRDGGINDASKLTKSSTSETDRRIDGKLLMSVEIPLIRIDKTPSWKKYSKNYSIDLRLVNNDWGVRRLSYVLSKGLIKTVGPVEEMMKYCREVRVHVARLRGRVGHAGPGRRVRLPDLAALRRRRPPTAHVAPRPHTHTDGDTDPHCDDDMDNIPTEEQLTDLLRNLTNKGVAESASAWRRQRNDQPQPQLRNHHKLPHLQLTCTCHICYSFKKQHFLREQTELQKEIEVLLDTLPKTALNESKKPVSEIDQDPDYSVKTTKQKKKKQQNVTRTISKPSDDDYQEWIRQKNIHQRFFKLPSMDLQKKIQKDIPTENTQLGTVVTVAEIANSNMATQEASTSNVNTVESVIAPPNVNENIDIEPAEKQPTFKSLTGNKNIIIFDENFRQKMVKSLNDMAKNKTNHGNNLPQSTDPTVFRIRAGNTFVNINHASFKKVVEDIIGGQSLGNIIDDQSVEQSPGDSGEQMRSQNIKEIIEQIIGGQCLGQIIDDQIIEQITNKVKENEYVDAQNVEQSTDRQTDGITENSNANQNIVENVKIESIEQIVNEETINSKIVYENEENINCHLAGRNIEFEIPLVELGPPEIKVEQPAESVAQDEILDTDTMIREDLQEAIDNNDTNENVTQLPADDSMSIVISNVVSLANNKVDEVVYESSELIKQCRGTKRHRSGIDPISIKRKFTNLDDGIVDSSSNEETTIGGKKYNTNFKVTRNKLRSLEINSGAIGSVQVSENIGLTIQVASDSNRNEPSSGTSSNIHDHDTSSGSREITDLTLSGHEEIWIPPPSVLDSPIKSGDSLLDPLSVYEVGAPMSLSEFKTLIADAVITVSEPIPEASGYDGNNSVVLLDNIQDCADIQVFIFKPAEETCVASITDDLHLDEATTSIVTNDTAGSDVTDEQLPKMSNNDHETTSPKTVKSEEIFGKSSDVSDNEQIEDDGDFPTTDGSDHISDGGDKSQNASKKSTPCDSLTVLPKITDISLEEVAPTKSAGQRSWDRRNCCPYCENLVTNFTRHVTRNHGDEVEVLKLMAIKDSDPKIQKKKRQAITENLRNRGNYIHNSNVVSNNKGYLIPSRRKPHKEVPGSPSGFVICRKCLGTYKRSTFYRHSKKCIGEEDDTAHHALAKHALSITPKFAHTSKEFQQNILCKLRSDEISRIVKQDPLIIAYGCTLLTNMKVRSVRSVNVICSRMRDLANLLKIVREKNSEITQLQNLFEPKYYECFIEAVKVMSGFDEETGYVKKVSVPARIRLEIFGCIDILFTNTIMDKSIAEKEDIKNKLNGFKLLFVANWQWEVSSNAEKTRKRDLMTEAEDMPPEKEIEEVMIKMNELEEDYDDKKKDIKNVNCENIYTDSSSDPSWHIPEKKKKKAKKRVKKPHSDVEIDDIMLVPPLPIAQYLLEREAELQSLLILCIDLSKPIWRLFQDQLVVTDYMIPFDEPSYWSTGPAGKTAKLILPNTQPKSNQMGQSENQMDQNGDQMGQSRNQTNLIGNQMSQNGNQTSQNRSRLEDVVVVSGRDSNVSTNVFTNTDGTTVLLHAPDEVCIQNNIYKRIYDNPLVYARVKYVVSDINICSILETKQIPIELYSLRTGVISPTCKEAYPKKIPNTPNTIKKTVKKPGSNNTPTPSSTNQVTGNQLPVSSTVLPVHKEPPAIDKSSDAMTMAVQATISETVLPPSKQVRVYSAPTHTMRAVPSNNVQNPLVTVASNHPMFQPSSFTQSSILTNYITVNPTEPPIRSFIPANYIPPNNPETTTISDTFSNLPANHVLVRNSEIRYSPAPWSKSSSLLRTMGNETNKTLSNNVDSQPKISVKSFAKEITFSPSANSLPAAASPYVQPKLIITPTVPLTNESTPSEGEEEYKYIMIV